MSTNADAFTGEPIEVRYQTDLQDTAGQPAHAATYIRRRLIILGSELKRDPREHERILLHELFHFVWVRLGNPVRRQWENLLQSEWREGVKGEAGWSAEWRKLRLHSTDANRRTRHWREYCCESFCDTGAWVVCGDPAENTLSRTYRARRRAWFTIALKPNLPI